MEKIFDFSNSIISSKFLNISFDQIKKGNLLRIYLKEFVLNELTKKIPVNQSQFEHAREKFYEDNNISNDNDLKNYLLFNGINREDLEYQINLPVKIDLLSRKVPQNKIEKHFLKVKDELDLYTYNVIRVENSNLAHEIYFQLEGGESNFLILSNKYSLDKKTFPNGVVGPRNLVGMHPLIIEKLRNYDVGTLIKPFQINNWWLIIKLLEEKQAMLDEQTTKRIAFELCEIFIQNKVSEIIKKNIEHFN